MIAEKYVKLVLEIGQYDPDYIDFYLGPDEWKADLSPPQSSFPYNELKEKTACLQEDLKAFSADGTSEKDQRRFDYLNKQITSILTKIDLLANRKMAFDEQSQGLYDIVSPKLPEEYFTGLLDELEEILPGKEPLKTRYDKFMANYRVPIDRTKDLIEAAIAESKTRVLKYVELHQEDSTTIEVVQNKPWGGYNWYQGNNHSLIQINVDKPRVISTITHLACHEGYPGHHVALSLQERCFLKTDAWMEYSIYPLNSPHSVILEGTAEYGIHLLFPDNEKVEFEQEMLFPLAGFDGSEAVLCDRVFNVSIKLRSARIEIARSYLDGQMDRDEAVSKLMIYLLQTKEEAEKSLKGLELFQSYLINYTVGLELIKEYVEGSEVLERSQAEKWSRFIRILKTPTTPSGLTRELSVER